MPPVICRPFNGRDIRCLRYVQGTPTNHRGLVTVFVLGGESFAMGPCRSLLSTALFHLDAFGFRSLSCCFLSHPDVRLRSLVMMSDCTTRLLFTLPGTITMIPAIFHEVL